MNEAKDFAVGVAKEAGEILMKHHGKMQNLEWKLKNNFKTEVDDLSDELIRNRITERFPDHSIYSEEMNNKETGSELKWVVDPLDGTLPYTYGMNDYFAVSIGLVKGKDAILGVLYAPKRNEMYVAEKNKGVTLNGKKISVNTNPNVNQAIVAMDYGKLERENHCDYQKALLKENGVTYPMTYGCASVSMGMVAQGKLDGYMSLKLEPWDMAASVVINREAGAKVTDIEGKDWELGDESILCANPGLHKNLYNLFQEEHL